MVRNCIFPGCGKPANSREHLFPASLGGLRVDKNIYCADHNNALSPLTVTLSTQLSLINSLLGVRSGHSGRLHSFRTTDPVRGQEYLISAHSTELAEPRYIESLQGDGDVQPRIEVSSERQLQQLLARERSNGRHVPIGDRQEGIRYFVEPAHAKLQFGGPEGLRAIGYVALTFLAHYFPEIARDPGLVEFTRSIISNSDIRFVWWESCEHLEGVCANRYCFGHRIVLGLSAARQQAFARVSLFSTLDFAILFGEARIESDRAVIVDIDPLADHAPNDIHVEHRQICIADVYKPLSLTEELRDSIETGEGQRCFEQLLHNISVRDLERVTKDLLPTFVGFGTLPAHECRQQILATLGPHKQRILILLSKATKQLRSLFLANKEARLVPIIDGFVAGDPASPTGLSQITECTLEIATGAVADEICRALEHNQLDQDRLAQVLGGGQGIATVGKAVLSCLMVAIGIVEKK